MTDVIAWLRKDLQANIDPKTKDSFQRYFKEKVVCYGLKSSTVTSLSNKYFDQVKDMSKKEIFELCEELLRSGYCEEAWIAASWVYKCRKSYQPEDFQTLERWIDQYIDNWAECDTFCNHAVGDFVEQYPEYLEELKRWAKSDNLWLRRAAAVTLIIPAKEGKFLKDIFEIADILLLDKEDMVQKGYGWMLKETSKAYQKEVFDYVVKNKSVMPRTALRYAIEKMPPDLKKIAMARD